jgi:hypothetical protein
MEQAFLRSKYSITSSRNFPPHLHETKKRYRLLPFLILSDMD